MNWFERGRRYADEKAKLTQAHYDLDSVWEAFRKDTAGLSARSEEFQQRISAASSEADLIVAEIEAIETGRLRRRASRYQIPVPLPPYGSGEDDVFWTFSRAHGTFYLSEEGKFRLRRMIYEEAEIRSKPLLGFAALGISVISLVVSVLK